MTGFSEVCTSVPNYQVKLEQLPDIAAGWLKDHPAHREKFLRISQQCGVERRHLCQPATETLQVGKLRQRAMLFEELAPPLLAGAIHEALDKQGYDAKDIGAFLFTSCSVPVIPSIDAVVAQQIGFSPSITRIPIFQHGCAGGVAGLSLGAKLAQLGKPVIVSSVELCSLVFQPANLAGAQLVAAALFADGAAATIIDATKHQTVRIEASRSILLPQTRHLMGYDLHDDGLHLRLERELPGELIKNAPHAIEDFLNSQNLQPTNIDYWLFHPGGIKILDLLEEHLQLRPDQSRWSRNVLRDYGNMSSATIFFVIQKFINEGIFEPGQRAVVLGIGPGLTVEIILLQAAYPATR